MTVKIEELKDGKPAAPTRRPRIGFLRPAHVEAAFVVLVYTSILVLVALSIIGTFYGMRDMTAPLATPLRIIRDIGAAPIAFGIALAVQIVLMITQYGAHLFTRHNKRWWGLYLVALAASIWFNVQAYWTPLLALGVGWVVASVLLVVGDILPEVAAVRRA
jgi:hypothetical protein